MKERNRTASTRFKVLFPFVALGGLVVTAGMAFVTALIVTGWLGQPVPILGFEQTFDQPVLYPHTVHAGNMPLLNPDGTPRLGNDGQPLTGVGLDCTFCHRMVTSQANAGVPSVQQCMFCHQAIGPEANVELQKLRLAGGLTDITTKAPVNWKRIHRMPDHVRFVHEAHIRFLTANPAAIRNPSSASLLTQSTVPASAVCSTCHGDVAAMAAVAQVEPLKMGQCVNCHRDNNAPTDCTVCHH